MRKAGGSRGADSAAAAPSSSARPSGAVAVASSTPSLVLTPAPGYPSSDPSLSNAPEPPSSTSTTESAQQRTAADGGKGRGSGGREGGVVGGKTRERKRGKGDGGGPSTNGGGAPKCGSPTAVERASASAIPLPKVNISLPKDTPRISPENIPPMSADIPPLSGEYTPFSENIPPSNGDIPLIQIDIHAAPADELPPYFPEPGTVVRQPALGRNVGRTHDGRVIPHERSEAVAAQIAEWVAIGAGENEIAQFLNLRLGVIRKHYKFELMNGKFANDMAVGKTILDLAKSGASERMTLLYAKAKMGWRESDSNDTNNAALLNIHIHN